MERLLNEEEKIRKAKEIYYRRNNKSPDFVNREKDKVRIYKGSIKHKILLQLLVMFDIAVLVFCIQNKDYIFTQEFLGKLNECNMNLSSQVIGFLGNIVGAKENISEENTVTNKNSETNPENVVNNQNENNIGGIIQNNSEQLSSSLSEMDLDVANLKAAYSFEKPISGTITSIFGSRESNNKNVTGYHTGMDIASEEGNYIKASMQGIVTMVSNEGDYGNHFKIRCNNVTTLYAHCLEIFVKEGQIVSQGQDVATIGNTGNSTGPHLHFEIRVDDRFVDPSRLIQF